MIIIEKFSCHQSFYTSLFSDFLIVAAAVAMAAYAQNNVQQE
jgi:hypothetical protein